MNAKSVILEFETRSQKLSLQELKVEARSSPTKLKIRKIKKSDYEFLLKKFLKDFDEEKQAQIWLNVYSKSPYRNLDSIAIDFFKVRQKRKTFPLEKFGDDFFRMIEKIDCWKTGDMLASLTSQVHEMNPKKYYPLLKKLSKNKSPWQNRMSLLSLYYYSFCRSRYPTFDQSIQLVQLHLNAAHYHLQKSVGWTLREINNVYPKQTRDWIEIHLHSLSPIAFTTATEKIKDQQKEEWKKKRQQFRLLKTL